MKGQKVFKLIIYKMKIKLFIFMFIVFSLISCETIDKPLMITTDDFTICVGETKQLEYTKTNVVTEPISFITLDEVVKVSSSGLIEGMNPGLTKVRIISGNYSDTINITVIEGNNPQLVLSSSKSIINIEESTELIVALNGEFIDDFKIKIIENPNCCEIKENLLFGLMVGTVTVIAEKDGVESNQLSIKIIESMAMPTHIELKIDKTIIEINETATLSFETTPLDANKNITYVIVDGEENISIKGNIVTAISKSPAIVYGYIGDVFSNKVYINTKNFDTDPYLNMTKDEFYQNYIPAVNCDDAYYRSLHGFLSGTLLPQDQKPTISNYQPVENNSFIRNTSAIFSDDFNTYYVLDAYGDVCLEVYRGGAYIILEEVAAYVYAFGNVPANYDSYKNASPKESIWEEFLRVNNTYFSGDTNRYPFEPVLPDISGCGGNLKYYEMDLGTTGTDCDPRYNTRIYNDGKSIVRGAARIVYTRYDQNGDEIFDLNEKYLFYTYNHYNDFQEYLNYYGGWGEMFGNITGGGQISSTSDYNPTAYVKTAYKDFSIISTFIINDINLVYYKREEWFY